MAWVDGDMSRKFFVGLDDGGAKRNNIYREKGQEMGKKVSTRQPPASNIEVKLPESEKPGPEEVD